VTLQDAPANCSASVRLTSSGLAATVPDAKVFRNGRQFGAWLGLTPRQHSSGGRTPLGHISLRGNVYLRTLLVQGARSTLQSALQLSYAEIRHRP
jgi:transposase